MGVPIADFVEPDLAGADGVAEAGAGWRRIAASRRLEPLDGGAVLPGLAHCVPDVSTARPVGSVDSVDSVRPVGRWAA